MDTPQVASYAAGLVFAISAGWYTLDVARKRVTVSVVTFFLFSLINMSQLFALISEGVWGGSAVYSCWLDNFRANLFVLFEE